MLIINDEPTCPPAGPTTRFVSGGAWDGIQAGIAQQGDGTWNWRAVVLCENAGGEWVITASHGGVAASVAEAQAAVQDWAGAEHARITWQPT